MLLFYRVIFKLHRVVLTKFKSLRMGITFIPTYGHYVYSGEADYSGNFPPTILPLASSNRVEFFPVDRSDCVFDGFGQVTLSDSQADSCERFLTFGVTNQAEKIVFRGFLLFGLRSGQPPGNLFPGPLVNSKYLVHKQAGPVF